MALPHAEDYYGIAVAPSGDIFYTFYHPGIFDLSHVNTNGGAIDGFGGYGASSKYLSLSEFYGSCIPSYIPCEGVYVTDPIGNLVVKFESSTSPAYGDSYVQAWSSYHAAGIATIGGQVYVSSSDGGKITKYSPYGTELSSFATGAVNAEGLAAGPNGTLYLADRGVGPGSSRLLVFSTTGALLASVGSTVAGYSYGPAEYVGIAVTGDGTVFAGDYSHSRVLKFSQTPTASKAVTLGQLKALYH